jgi:hypothetical protein
LEHSFPTIRKFDHLHMLILVCQVPSKIACHNWLSASVCNELQDHWQLAHFVLFQRTLLKYGTTMTDWHSGSGAC